MNEADTPSRRGVLSLVGKIGGVAAVYNTMNAMGLLPLAAAYAGPPDLPPALGVRVIVIGAGIAGMVAAYELGRAGFAVTVLEARSRPGGRNWTIRAGDVVQETDSRQHVRWDADEHLYLNAGPARIPSHHEAVLSYCRQFDVPLEVFVNDDRAAFFQDDGAFSGNPQRARAVAGDCRGYIAELAAKAVNRNVLDQPLTKAEQDRLLAFIRKFGDLEQDFAYRGSSRSGYVMPPGVEDGQVVPPLALDELLRSDFWPYKTAFTETFPQAATMLQPIGGMDRIAYAFAKRLGNIIRYNAVVAELRRTDHGVRVIWRDSRTGRKSALEASYALCTLPFPVLTTLDADFSPERCARMAEVGYVSANKVAFQAKRRFWEEDAQIYGGITWTKREITQIWYPSAGFHRQKGILVGAYIWDNDIGNTFAALTPAERFDRALASGARIHPGYADNLGAGVAVAWPKIPFTGGGWAEWSDAVRRDAYELLRSPDGPIYFAGEHLSYINGWQEGAVRSAHYAIAQISAAVQARRNTTPN